MTVSVACTALLITPASAFAADITVAPEVLELPLAVSGVPPETMTPTFKGGEVARLRRTFHDDFNDFLPGRPPWRHRYDRKDDRDSIERRTQVSNGEQQVYVDPDFSGSGSDPLGLDPFEVIDGTLRITGREAPASALPYLGGYRYISGLLSTESHFEQRYGYFEARLRVPEGQGLWSAFWMKRAARLAPDGVFNWPPEIDVMEFIGRDTDRYFATVHWDVYPNNQKSGVGHSLGDKRGEFRSYGVLWTRERTVFYLDREPHHVIETKPNHHVPMFMMVNLALGGNWPGDVDPSLLPASLEIDWVAAWEILEP